MSGTVSKGDGDGGQVTEVLMNTGYDSCQPVNK